MWYAYFLVLSLLFANIKCYYEFDEDFEISPLKDSAELANDFGLDLEKFEVNSNGYIISVYHIKPITPDSPVVLLQHGMTGAADIWFLRENTPGVVLNKLGKDVWMSTVRGAVHSRKHEKLNPDTDGEYWDFSWEEMGTQDMPVVIDFILEKTKKTQLYYLGHSMGTTMFLVMASRRTEYNDKIKEAILLAPSYYFIASDYQSMITNDSVYYSLAESLNQQFIAEEKWEVLPRSDVPKTPHQLTFDDVPEAGASMLKIMREFLNATVGQWLPAGSSYKTIIHYKQAFFEGQIRSYDYGEEENVKKYNQSIPPLYDLKKITSKVNVFIGVEDKAISRADAVKVADELPNLGLKWEIPDFRHMDFSYLNSEENEASFNEYLEKLNKILV